MHLIEQKTKLRESIKKRILSMPENDKQAESCTLCQKLLPNIPKGSTVCGYFPLQNEVDITSLLNKLLNRKDAVFLPRYHNHQVTFHRVQDLKNLEKGDLNIPEPSRNVPALNIQPDIVLVPGRAFDRTGARLGRGGGGYDKWIASQRTSKGQAKFIGIGYECQIINEVPTEPHDEKMDIIATASGIEEVQ